MSTRGKFYLASHDLFPFAVVMAVPIRCAPGHARSSASWGWAERSAGRQERPGKRVLDLPTPPPFEGEVERLMWEHPFRQFLLEVQMELELSRH